MTKSVTHINCPEEWGIKDDYSSHRPALWLALSNTSGDVIELGCGEGSTELMSDYCFNVKRRRKFISFEKNAAWAEKIGAMKVDDYKSINPMFCGMVFIDSAPGEERKYLIARYFHCADVVVVHDTEGGAYHVYQMEEIIQTFKYRLDFTPDGMPHTTILSNSIDVTKWV